MTSEINQSKIANCELVQSYISFVLNVGEYHKDSRSCFTVTRSLVGKLVKISQEYPGINQFNIANCELVQRYISSVHNVEEYKKDSRSRYTVRRSLVGKLIKIS